MAKSDRTHSLEESLSRMLLELKNSSSDEDIEFACQKSNSLGRVKTMEEYKRDRDHTIRSLKQVNEPRLLAVQSQGLLKEVENCTIPEYTPFNLPLLLHQYFCGRVSQMVLLKHNLQLRWARFALNDPKLCTALDEDYQHCIRYAFEEYNVCLNHARRLSVAVDLFKAGKPCPSDLIGEEEVGMYLRSLTHLFHTTRRIMSFITEVQLLPLRNQEQPDAPTFKPQAVGKSQAKWRRLGNKMRRLSQTLSLSHSSSSISIGLSSEDLTASSTRNVAATEEEEDDVVSSALPSISMELDSIKEALQQLMVAYSIHTRFSSNESSSEQLKLFYMVYGQFKVVFQQQVESLTFCTYDVVPKKIDHKNQKSNLIFSKPSNWLDSIELRPNPDVLQVRSFIEIKDTIVDLDPILDLCCRCTHVNTLEKALFALKQHYEAIHSSSDQLRPTAVANNQTGQDPMLLWKCIYSAVDMRNPLNIEENKAKFSFDEQKESHLAEVRGSTSVQEAMHLLEDDEGRQISANAESMPQNAYFAFILLRHVRIREKRIKCLWSINYMCSVERTLTINGRGLSQEPDQGPSSIGTSLHLFKTPADFIVSTSEFMQYLEVENHDDYYSFDEPLIRVWDQAGKLVMYDTAEDRLEKLEQDLLTTASYYIQKDILNVNRKNESSDSGVDIGSLSQPKMDRFAILLDIWTVHSRFLDSKVKLINLYLEAYHSVYDKKEKEKLAQMITDLIALSPRLDPQASYFTEAYKKETECLDAQFEAMQPILKYTLESEREYNFYMCMPADKKGPHGLPPKIKEKKLINLSGDLRTGIEHYLLECANSLSVVSLLPPLIDHCLQMAVGLGNLTSVSTIVPVNTTLWRRVESLWSNLKPLGAGFSEDIQHRIFSQTFIDNPHNMVKLMELHLKQMASKHEHSPPLERQRTRMQGYCDILQLLTSHHNLIRSCHTSFVLHHVYLRQLEHLELEKSHAYLRFTPFNHSAYLESAKDLDTSIQAARNPKSSQPDNYTLPHVPIAVQELDDTHVGRFSFHSKEDLIKILMSKNGLKNLMVTVQAQVSYQNALLVICQQSACVIRFTVPLVKDRKFTDFSHLTSAVSQHSDHIQLLYLLQGSVVSFQKEKAAVRDHMLAQFTTLPAMKGSEAIEEGKCSMISKYSKNLVSVLNTFSLRHQIIVVYMRLNTTLEQYPTTKNAFFTYGGVTIPSPVQSNASPQTSKAGKVKALFSYDGKTILNLFFIPHVSDIITMFSSLSIEEQTNALTNVLSVASALGNIINYTCAVTKLGPLCNRIGAHNTGTDGIGGEILHLQHQISDLKHPNDPKEVVALLNLYYTSLILSHDVAIRYYLRQTLLRNQNENGVLLLDSVCIPVLNRLTTAGADHPMSYPLLDGECLERGDEVIAPWRHFLTRYGCCLISAGALVDVLSIVFDSVAPLNPSGRQVASGELSAMSLLLEDVLLTSELGQTAGLSGRAPSTISRLSRFSQTFQLTHGSNPLMMSPMRTSKPLPSLPPLAMNKVIYQFLTLAIQVEKLKLQWGCNVLGRPYISTSSEARHLDNIFQAKVGKFAKRLVAKQEARSLIRMQMDNETVEGGSMGSMTTLLTDTDLSLDSFEQAMGLNEMSLQEAQLFRLQDLVDQQLIESEIKHVGKLLQLSLQEIQKDAENLPIDLWKGPSMKDIPGIPRPQIVEEFISSLREGMTSGNRSVVELPQNHFKLCVNQLSSAVLAREKECYQIYASFYESTIQSLYHQLYLKNQEIKSCHQQIKQASQQNREESLVLAADNTYNLLLEITSLRTKITQLTRQLNAKESEVRQSVIKEYSELMNELAASGIMVKNKYEQYRQMLYDETVAKVYRTRQNIAANVEALKERLSFHAAIDETVISSVKAEKNQEIQKENAYLSNMLYKTRSVDQWRRAQLSAKTAAQESSLREELNRVQNDYLYLKIETDQQVTSLKQRIKELQRNLTSEELKGEILSKTLEEEKQKKMYVHRPDGKNKTKSSRLERMQEERLEKLLHDLDDKDRQLHSLTATQEEQLRSVDYENKRMARALKNTKQHLNQERHLKLDAFHQIDELISQVGRYEQSMVEGRSATQTPTSFITKTVGTATPSSIRSSSRFSSVKPELLMSSHSLRIQRPKSEEGRLQFVTPSEISSNAMGIGAFKLI